MFNVSDSCVLSYYFTMKHKFTKYYFTEANVTVVYRRNKIVSVLCVVLDMAQTYYNFWINKKFWSKSNLNLQYTVIIYQKYKSLKVRVGILGVQVCIFSLQ